MSQLTRSLDRASDFATKTLSLSRDFRVKASAAEIIGDAMPGGDAIRREDYSSAANQYRANRNWVFACVDLVSQRIAGQQIHIASDRAGGGGPKTTKAIGDDLEPLPTHPLLDLLATPNVLMSGAALLYSTVASVELTGRSLWWVSEDQGALTILPIPTSWIQSVDDRRSMWKIRLPKSTKTLDIPGEQTVLFNRQDPADPSGCLSILAQIAESVEIDSRIIDAHWRIFAQGHWPQFALIAGRLPPPPGSSGPAMRPHLTPEQRQQLIVSCQRAHQGSTQAGKALILDGLIEDVKKLSLTPSELDFLESSKVSKSRILQAFRCSPILLGEVEGANRASATVADEIFCSATVNPIISLISQALTRYLAPMFAKDGEKLTLWIEPARAKDDEQQLARWTAALNRGCVTVNEFRKTILNLPPVDGGDELAEPGGVSSPPPAELKAMIDRLDPYSMRTI